MTNCALLRLLTMNRKLKLPGYFVNNHKARHKSNVCGLSLYLVDNPDFNLVVVNALFGAVSFESFGLLTKFGLFYETEADGSIKIEGLSPVRSLSHRNWLNWLQLFKKKR